MDYKFGVKFYSVLCCWSCRQDLLLSSFYGHGGRIELMARSRKFGLNLCHNANNFLESGILFGFKHMCLKRRCLDWQACGWGYLTTLLEAKGRLGETQGAVAAALPMWKRALIIVRFWRFFSVALD